MQRAKNATPYMRLSCLVLASLKHRKLLQSGFLLSRVTGDDFHCLLQPDCLPVIGQQVESVLRIQHYGLVTIHIPALALIDILYKIAVCACIPHSCIHVHGKYEHREVASKQLVSFSPAPIAPPTRDSEMMIHAYSTCQSPGVNLLGIISALISIFGMHRSISNIDGRIHIRRQNHVRSMF